MPDETSIQSFVDKVNASRGKSKGWPNNFEYAIQGDKAILKFVLDFNKRGFRRLDSWGLAFFAEAKTIFPAISTLSLQIDDMPKYENAQYDFEAFRRRVSFLNFNNANVNFEIVRSKRQVHLDSRDELLNEVKPGEIVRTDQLPRGDGDSADLLEKALQAYLFGKDMEVRTNDRLAIFGQDFWKLKGKGFGILREFATGVFQGSKAKATRVLPTEYVDIVSVNKHALLSIIELKIDDSQLEVISQILDYALFFRKYLKQLLPFLESELITAAASDGRHIDSSNIMCYVVNNGFHKKFQAIQDHKFYSTHGKEYGFEMVRILLGATEKL